jgi:D-lactate dehydrogenase (cytochrome)
MFLRERISGDSKYLFDRSTLKGHAKNVILPNDETELREGMRYSNKGNTKVTISGTRMGSSGGAVPTGGDVMSMENLSGIIGIGSDEKGTYVRVLPCTTISQFNNSLSVGNIEPIGEGCDTKGLRFPVKTALEYTVGGCISANRSGIRPYVRRIRVVFADSTFTTIQRGEFIAEGRRITFPAGRNYYSFDIPDYDSKDDYGPGIRENMDLIDLFIGSEGIFGIITEADIYIASEETEAPTKEFGKLYNGYIRETYGQSALDGIRRVKEILDANYILNIGNLL